MAKPVAKMEYYKVLYEFDPRNPDEMALEEGDIVVVSLFVFSLLQYRATTFCMSLLTDTSHFLCFTWKRDIRESPLIIMF